MAGWLHFSIAAAGMITGALLGCSSSDEPGEPGPHATGGAGGSGGGDGGGVVPVPTIHAKSCEAADVQAAVDSATDGDVVGIPAGTCTWLTPVTIGAKAIVVTGAGIDQTVIVDDVDKSTGIDAVALTVELALGKKFRLTSLTFRGKAQDINSYNKGTLQLGGNARDFRVDRVKFDRPGSSAIRYSGELWGVVDHCVFDLSGGGQGHVIWHEGWNGQSYGDGSFSDALYLGTDKAIYIEDSVFIGTGVAGQGVVDSMAGGRFVFRHNQVTDENLATHGTESTGRYRGVRSYEIYENTFTTNTVMFAGAYLRGGTGVVFGNTFTGYKTAIVAANYRSTQSYEPFGQCDGTNPFDGNQETNGYPCLDQVGRGLADPFSGETPAAQWPNQAVEPVHVWDVTWNPVPDYPGELAGSQHDVVKIGRDVLVGSPKPGYTPYTYPHPLASP
jgi:hypothetical protein